MVCRGGAAAERPAHGGTEPQRGGGVFCSEQRQGGRLRDGRGQGETRARFKGSRVGIVVGSSGEGIPAISPVISGTAVARGGKRKGRKGANMRGQHVSGRAHTSN